jgi:CBS-domain-containing membrane protein
VLTRLRSLEQLTALREMMTTQVHTVAPETKVADCVTLIHRERIRHLPLVSGGGLLRMRTATPSLSRCSRLPPWQWRSACST